jgi:hypothetical protein
LPENRLPWNGTFHGCHRGPHMRLADAETRFVTLGVAPWTRRLVVKPKPRDFCTNRLCS